MTETLLHHQLCFGCGTTNLFGLLLDAQRAPDGTVAGRCFIKQDHQGPEPGHAHPGILACALAEAMLLAGGQGVELDSLAFELVPHAGVPVGTFCVVHAAISGRQGETVSIRATASAAEQPVARATATLRRRDPQNGTELD